MKTEVENKLFELLEFAKKNKLFEVNWKNKDIRIAFKRGAQPKSKKGKAPEESKAPAVEIPCQTVGSPVVGTFRRSGSKNHPPFVVKGNHVKPGDRLGVVECMKIPTDVVSFCSGKIKKILVEDGQSVEYGQPLFSIQDENQPANGNGKN